MLNNKLVVFLLMTHLFGLLQSQLQPQAQQQQPQQLTKKSSGMAFKIQIDMKKKTQLINWHFKRIYVMARWIRTRGWQRLANAISRTT